MVTSEAASVAGEQVAPARDGSPLLRMRHSTAHIMAQAVQRLFPGTTFGIGPAIEDGFYYDFDSPHTFSPEDFPAIEAEMRKIVAEDYPFVLSEVPRAEARRYFAERKEPYKVDLIDRFPEGERVTFYTDGDFVDLCAGPHVASTGKVGAFRLRSVAGAYWHGDEHQPMLQRIYGLAFATPEELEHHEWLLEEAKKRDHRRLGQELDLFTFSELVGAGLPLFLPRGTMIRRLLEEFVQSLQEPLGYQRVSIPHITKIELYKVSGHWEKFKDDLFHVTGKSGEDFALKPMNCPHHTQIYAARQRSYRDLPIRLSEVTAVYRDELPGTLLGLSRVRAITQDDAHVFCRPEQVMEEALRIYAIVEGFYRPFGMPLGIRLSLWDPAHPEKYLGDAQTWATSQEQLREVLRAKGATWVEEVGEAAFYGPKIDFNATDALGRVQQLATLQLDFNLPERFDLTYITPEGTPARPVMLHRAILGSVERFMAILIEHFAGAFPLWLSPVQAVVIPIADRHNDYAEQVAKELQAAGLRVEVDGRREGMRAKIRDAQLQKTPYMLVVGDKETQAGQVAVRVRTGQDLGPKPVSEFRELATRLAAEKSLELAPGAEPSGR
jgi:threonyl-tRNA synthetase